MTTYIIISTLAQVAMVTGGHFSPTILGLSAVLGVGIPVVLGVAFGATHRPSYKKGAGGAFIFSFVGAFIGVIAAVLMGDQPWMLLTFAPLSSGVTGALGGLLGAKLAGGPAT